jgi:copper chaperone CopZ
MMLARRKTSATGRALSFWGVLEPRHELPGRLRLWCGVVEHDRERADRVTRELPRLPGVSSVRADSRSGSIVIEYDAARIDVQTIQAGIIKLLGLESRVERAGPSLLTRETNNMLDALNRAVLDLTRGVADVDFLVPTVLMTLAGIHLVRRSAAGVPAGITLFWWAFAYMAGRSGA